MDEEEADKKKMIRKKGGKINSRYSLKTKIQMTLIDRDKKNK